MGSSNHHGRNYCFLLCNFDLFLPEGDGTKDLQLREQLQMYIIHLFPYIFFFERHNFEASFWQENGIQSNWDKLHMKLIQVAILLHIRHFLEEVNSFSLRSINFLLTDIFFFLPSSSGAEVLFVFVFISSSQNPLGRAWRTTYNLINSSLGFPECP